MERLREKRKAFAKRKSNIPTTRENSANVSFLRTFLNLLDNRLSKATAAAQAAHNTPNKDALTVNQKAQQTVSKHLLLQIPNSSKDSLTYLTITFKSASFVLRDVEASLSESLTEDPKLSNYRMYLIRIASQTFKTELKRKALKITVCSQALQFATRKNKHKGVLGKAICLPLADFPGPFA